MRASFFQITLRDILIYATGLTVIFLFMTFSTSNLQAVDTSPEPAVQQKKMDTTVDDTLVKKEGKQRENPDAGRQPSLKWGNAIYSHYCIPCHGINGDGKGFNAAKLIVKPANHSDSVFMSARNDQKLFDTINLGGIEVAKSTLMPPWGAALNNDNKIKSLILKLRDLCQCQAKKNW